MDALPICTHCGFTWGEYRSRGLLGCPHCYAAFGEALQGDLMWIHQALAQSPAALGASMGPESSASPASKPDVPAGEKPPALSPADAARLREKLADAVRKEDYAEAARLQRILRGEPPGRTSGS